MKMTQLDFLVFVDALRLLHREDICESQALKTGMVDSLAKNCLVDYSQGFKTNCWRLLKDEGFIN